MVIRSMPQLTPAERKQVLDRAVDAWVKRFDFEPEPHPEELETELPHLPLEAQVPISEALRWAGYPAFRDAVIAAMRSRP